MNKEEINKIQKVIDKHRKKMFTTCVETCPCWKIQSLIDTWKMKHNINSLNTESKKEG